MRKQNINCLSAKRRFAGLATVVSYCATAALPALAQTSTQAAEDAFGRRAGIDQVGLYSESQARGFNLTNSNAYRIGDSYFSRSWPLSDAIIEHVGVRLGVSAARSHVPSPTGIVSYTLRSTNEPRQRMSFGYRDYSSPFLDLDLRGISAEGKVGFAFGALVLPDITFPDGVAGKGTDFGGVIRARLGEGSRLAAFASVSKRWFGGNYAFVPTGSALPPMLASIRNLGPSYARFLSSGSNVGLIGDWSLGSATRINASAVRSTRDQARADSTLLAMSDSLDTGATATLFRTPGFKHVSDAIEVRAERDFRVGKTVHSVEVSGRSRRTDAPSARGTHFALGKISLFDPMYGPEPEADAATGLTGDRTRQDSLSAGYRAQIAERLEVRLGGSFTAQQRDITPLLGDAIREESSFVLPYASAVWLPTSSLTIFGSYGEGLEDSGAAPPRAANGNEILAPVVARQVELGVTRRWGPNFSLSAAAFDIEKPVPGLDVNNVYRFLGDVRHRGGELTLSARAGVGTSILAGMTAFDARRADGRAPAGVSEQAAFARVEHQISPKTSMNALVNYRAGQDVGGASAIRTDSGTRLDLGLQHDMALSGRSATLRATAVNVLDDRQWIATAGGTIIRSGPRAYRLSLTVDF